MKKFTISGELKFYVEFEIEAEDAVDAVRKASVRKAYNGVGAGYLVERASQIMKNMKLLGPNFLEKSNEYS